VTFHYIGRICLGYKKHNTNTYMTPIYLTVLQSGMYISCSDQQSGCYSNTLV